MKRRETCYGVVPLREDNSHWEVFLVCHKIGGHWSFPKGHSEEGEAPNRTAARELKEETALEIIRWLDFPSFQDRYQFWDGRESVDKTVYYFLAEVAGDVSCPPEEIAQGEWFPWSEVENRITYPEAKELCRRIGIALQTMDQ